MRPPSGRGNRYRKTGYYTRGVVTTIAHDIDGRTCPAHQKCATCGGNCDVALILSDPNTVEDARVCVNRDAQLKKCRAECKAYLDRTGTSHG